MAVQTKGHTLGKKTDKKPRKIGLTEQLFRGEEKTERDYQKGLRKLHKDFTSQLVEKIEKTSAALIERDDITGFQLVELADAWSAEADFLNPTDLTLDIVIPRVVQAGISTSFFIHESDIWLIPESLSLAVPIREIGGEAIYALADADQIIGVMLFSEIQQGREGRLPTGRKVQWLLDWLDNLATENKPTE
jgi:hypothetical protein